MFSVELLTYLFRRYTGVTVIMAANVVCNNTSSLYVVNWKYLLHVLIFHG